MKQIFTQFPRLRLASKRSCSVDFKFVFALLAVLFCQSIAIAQNIKITGTVKDGTGETLPGVSVKLKGTQSGTMTDASGSFTINVPGTSSELQFTYVGYKTQGVKVGNQTNINVVMVENANDLDEVVVTGYGGAVKKRDLTSATSTVTAKMIEDRQPLNIFDALQGQATGVLVVNDNGEPGAEGSITIRGPSTFSSEGQGTDPLYVVDGVITPNFSSINPGDIQSFEILKDAASSAIYGSRAANGVILITTKKGVEGKPKLDVQYVYTMGRIAHEIQQSNPKDIRYYRQLQGQLGVLTDSLNPGLNSANDLQKLLLGNLAQKHDVRFSLSGGQKGLTYAASLNYLDDKGIALNTYVKRIQSRINVDYQATKKLKYSSNISVYRQAGNFANIGNSIRPVFDRPSSYLIYYPDGKLTSYINNKRNPVANALYEKNTREEYKVQFVNTLNYDFTKDLKLTVALNTQLDDGERFFFAPRYVYTQNGDKNYATNQFNKRFYYEAQSYLNYSKTFNVHHNFVATIGATRDRAKFSNVNLAGENFILENVTTITGANIVNFGAQRVVQSAVSTGSYFARANYSYKGRYLLSGVYRNDASSRFGEENRSGNFGSGSIAWRFTDEDFLKFTKSFLDDGKLRYSYGSLGNDAIGNYESIARVELGGNNYNGVAGAAPMSNLNNPQLKWETTIVQNVGLDLNFLKGRLTATLDAYVRNTKDLLYDRQMPKETGYNAIKVNVGDIENRGFEFSLMGTPIANEKFNWTVNANFTIQRGTIKKLYNGEEFVAIGTGGVSGGNANYLIREGGRIGDFYGWKNLGVYQYDVSNAYTPDGQKLIPYGVKVSGSGRGTSTAEGYTLNGQEYTGTIIKKKNSDGAVLLGGDTEWLDLDNDGIINDNDRHIIGNAQPDFYLGFINSFSYKQFSFSFIVNSTVGGKVYNQFKQNLTNFANNGNPSLPEAIYGAWTKQGDIATYPYYPDKDTRKSQRPGGNSYFLEDGSFIRLSNARFTYRLDPKAAKKVFARNLSVYMYGVNLLTYTNYTGYDPEFSPSSGLTPGDDTGKYPKRRELGFGLTMGF
ncbi:TonB-dependent receptor plug [Pseudopedobacter saltans DSM 12145]|uniref:TonB-dependent receptor plug n=1 Tax=Pseudopedobacter saltans (strain ATCC 51119 / DSM 12145 / JCM 21818 / CCUG 39354 / LMG 10337 / NBRC 100064 / NCIMB 13643) TaxID=762903 RepID=F0S5B6_PSESL|nr:TonB-dependent receptor [Pseudopedobacter saltans]ADY52061.1 TonB-dependent receptor plug [Pseudopedobacter saltans DSM 12145]